MERRGWRKFTGSRLPRGLIEFHILHGDRLYSGRCWSDHPPGDTGTPGTIAFVLRRGDMRDTGVWRPVNSGAVGMVARPAPF